MAILIVLILIFGAVSYEVFSLFRERNNLMGQVSDLQNKINNLNKDNDNLRAEIEYYSHPENLEKELLSKFNYKKPGEKMIIVVP